MKLSNDGPGESASERMARSLEDGIIVVDSSGEIAWMDDKTRRSIDGELKKLHLPIAKDEARHRVDCFVTDVDVEIKGETKSLCVIQTLDGQEAGDQDLHDLMVAVEELMADPSWFTRPLLEKLKAVRQASQRVPRASDLEILTMREREILALICDGHTDVEMGRILGLSQNTVRNHVASLFRKIGVNRRSAAVIWARERAITKHDALAFRDRADRGGSKKDDGDKPY